MEPLINVAGLITRTPGGAMGIFVIAPTVLALVIGVGTKSPPAALGGLTVGMAVCIVGLSLSPWLFMIVVCSALGAVAALGIMGWSGR